MLQNTSDDSKGSDFGIHDSGLALLSKLRNCVILPRNDEIHYGVCAFFVLIGTSAFAAGSEHVDPVQLCAQQVLELPRAGYRA